MFSLDPSHTELTTL